MKSKVYILYFMIFSSVFSYFKNKNDIIEVINSNTEYSCIYNEETIKIEGRNFIGNYYNERPYGNWELKNGSIKQCFLAEIEKYYSEKKYYIINGKNYYIKYDFKSNIYTIKDKENGEVYYFEKNNNKLIDTNNVNEKLKIPVKLYDLIEFKFQNPLRVFVN